MSLRFGFQHGLVEILSQEESTCLEVLPRKEEIKDAVWQCDLSKALRSEGFNLNFIGKLWDEIGNDFVKAVEAFFIPGSVP